MQYIVYILFRIAVFKVYLLPFNILYLVSDMLAFSLNHVFKYRKNVVIGNIKKCFPEKSEKEIKGIVRKFYLNLADVILESLKGFTMSEKELHERYNFLNRKILIDYFEKGINVICVSAHFSNWEWGVLIMGKQVKHKPFGVYKPLTNLYIDNYIEKKRKKLDMSLLTMENTIKGMRMKYDRPAVFILIADQSPSSRKKTIWVDFFGIKTACSPGINAASRLFSSPVVYILPRRKKRGYYEVDCELISVSLDSEGSCITQEYMSKLEANIRMEPSDWLWSHKRWKHEYLENTNTK